MTKLISSLLMITLASPALAAESGSTAPSYGTYVSLEASRRGAALEAEHRELSRITRDADGNVITTPPMALRGGAPTSTGGAGAPVKIVPVPKSAEEKAKVAADQAKIMAGVAGLRSARGRSPRHTTAGGGAAYEAERAPAPAASAPSPAPAFIPTAAGGSGASSSSPAPASGTVSILATDNAAIEARIGADFLGWFINSWGLNRTPYRNELKANIRVRDPSFIPTDAELDAFMAEFRDARINGRSIEVPIRYTKP